MIYVSPSAKYSSTYYAKVSSFEYNGKKMKGQMLVQCRVKPDCFKKFPQTLGKSWDPKREPEISSDEIEWVTADRQGVVPYGILVRVWDAEQ